MKSVSVDFDTKRELSILVAMEYFLDYVSLCIFLLQKFWWWGYERNIKAGGNRISSLRNQTMFIFVSNSLDFIYVNIITIDYLGRISIVFSFLRCSLTISTTQIHK